MTVYSYRDASNVPMFFTELQTAYDKYIRTHLRNRHKIPPVRIEYFYLAMIANGHYTSICNQVIIESKTI
ncbi:MAG: hypothetical protein V4560_11720 [Bacteroidota bacterium]